MRKPLLAALVLVAACGDTPPGGLSTGPGITSVSATTSSSSGEHSSSTIPDDSAGPEDTTSSTTNGVIGDVGTMPDFGPSHPPGCKGKVDLLFVISRQWTMEPEQAQLLASFQGFVETIETRLAEFDYHIMVANPDGYWPGWGCEQYKCPEYDPPSCGPGAESYQCNVDPALITACDETLGAGITFNAGENASNHRCELLDGNRYIVSGEPDLDEAFDCIARVGLFGTHKTGDALVAAVDPAINGDGGCNQGFLRDDALLVIVLISDTEDDDSKSTPQKQYDAIVAAKGGDPDAVVMLAVTPQPLTDPEQTCTWNDGDAKVRHLLEMFQYRVEGDTCAPSYASYFEAATAKIAEACGDFVPQ